MLALLCSPPRHPSRLSSSDRWTRNFDSKLPTAERIQQAARTIVAQVSAVVVNPISVAVVVTLRPQFVQLSTHDVAMLEPATVDDHVRRLVISVTLYYTRQSALVLSSVPATSQDELGTLVKFQFPTTSTNHSNVWPYKRALRCLE